MFQTRVGKNGRTRAVRSGFIPRVNQPRRSRGNNFNGTPAQLGLETKLVNGPPDPRSTNRDFALIKVATGVLELSSGGGVIDNTLIARMIPTSTKVFRIHKVSVYAPASATSFVRITDIHADEASFEDYGTQGSLRPQVHIRPALQVREQWYDPTVAGSHYNIAGSTSDKIVVQMTLEVRFVDTVD